MNRFFGVVVVVGLSACPSPVAPDGGVDAGPVEPVDSGVLLDAGVDERVLSWSPATIDFEFVTPGTTVERELTFSNPLPNPVLVSVLSAGPGPTFTANVSSVTIPPQGTAAVRVAFTPGLLGPRSGLLSATTSLARQRRIEVPLQGVGGGADIDVRPTALDFGRVAFFPGATPASTSVRSLTVQNVGARPTPDDPRSHLKLGQPGGGRFWSVRAISGGAASELCVGTFEEATGTCTGALPSSFPADGLVGGDSASLPVRITPTGLGLRSFEVSLYSNDNDEPVTVVTVAANVVSLPPCDVEISPPAIEFGLLNTPNPRELSVAVRNRLTGGNDVCLISNLRLQAEPVFSLAEAPFAELELQPGETKHIVVRAQVRGGSSGQVTSKVSFELTRPTQPLVEIPVSATLGAGCLNIYPSHFDFGVVRSGTCRSPERTFEISNSCANDVVIDAAGLVGGTEFGVTTGLNPGAQVLAQGAAPLTFTLRYQPVDVGTDLGSFGLRVTENGQPQSYVVPLQGTGDALGLTTERFVQPNATPKADVLLVLDNSASMAPRLATLASQFAGLVQSPANPIDVQVGVIDTELSGGALHATDAGIKVVRSSTPNAAGALRELMNVGSSGLVESCMAPATRALTSPLISDPAQNGGFLREDAKLSVICVTDAPDQAPFPPRHYLNQLLDVRGVDLTYNVMGPFLPMPTAGCVYDGLNDTAHDFMVAHTGGIKGEICSLDWTPSGGPFAELVSARTVFRLRSVPDVSVPIEVRIEGQAVPAVTPGPQSVMVWHHDLANNTIVFERLYAPEPGKTTTVSFRVACVP